MGGAGGPGRQAARIGALLIACLALAGCELLAPSFDDPMGEVIATYDHGRATLTIGDETITLDQIAPGPHLTRDYGAQVYWFNQDGWGVRLTGGGGFGGSFGFPASIVIDRVRTTYWSASDYESRCDVELAEVDHRGLRGTATCTGLRWSDVLRGGASYWGSDDGYIKDEPPFDAQIEFEAFPDALAT